MAHSVNINISRAEPTGNGELKKTPKLVFYSPAPSAASSKAGEGKAL
jgi:hypothetical protein